MSENKEKSEKTKKGFWKSFGKFMMYGGWLLILLLIFVIYITITIVTNGQS
jgi:hypothetical protein